jgi:hypothetical protein
MSGVFEQELKTDNKSGNSILRAFSGSGLDVKEGEIGCGRFNVDMAVNRYEFLEN